jgi:SnoaL-like domain
MLRPDDAYERYERAWNEPERAAALLDECWAEDGVYADDEVPDGVVGPAALAALITATHEALPGFRVWATSTPRMLAGRMGVTWAGEGGSPPESSAGADVIEFAADGRIARVTDVLTAT